MATRGSAKMLQEQAIPKKELERLWKLLDEDERVELVHWESRGTPAVDMIVGALKTERAAAGGVVGKLVGIKGLPLQLDLFQLGTPVPTEVLIRFGRGAAKF
jgi:hypothetical protein